MLAPFADAYGWSCAFSGGCCIPAEGKAPQVVQLDHDGPLTSAYPPCRAHQTNLAPGYPIRRAGEKAQGSTGLCRVRSPCSRSNHGQVEPPMARGGAALTTSITTSTTVSDAARVAEPDKSLTRGTGVRRGSASTAAHAAPSSTAGRAASPEAELFVTWTIFKLPLVT